MSLTPGTPARRRWIANMRWIAALLAVWFAVTFVVAFFARDLSMHFFNWDWTFAYWMGAQGAPIVYVLITVLYAWRTNRAADAAAQEAESMQPDAPEPPPSI